MEAASADGVAAGAPERPCVDGVGAGARVPGDPDPVAAGPPILVTVELLSGEMVIEDLPLGPGLSVMELKSMVERAEGTPVYMQQLLLDMSVLPNSVTLAGLGVADSVTLLMVRRSTAEYTWEAGGCSPASPPFCGEADGGVAGGLTLTYEAQSFNPLVGRHGGCSLRISRPIGTLLWCRLTFGDLSREMIATKAMNTDCTWINICPAPPEPPVVGLEVMHFAEISKPVVGSSDVEWDLRESLGGMPLPPGQPLPSSCVAFAYKEEAVKVKLVFFPGGQPRVEGHRSTLWIQPLAGLADDRYVATVDGTAQEGTGESVLHFPLVEHLGHIHVAFFQTAPDNGAGRVKRAFSEREGGVEMDASARADIKRQLERAFSRW